MEPCTPPSLPLRDIRWEPLIPLIGRANRALAHYDGVLYGLPNAELLLSPFTTQEAVLSSKIEGTQATLGDVLLFEAGDEPQEAEKVIDIQEILNYRRALRQAETVLKDRPFTLNLLRQLHDILLDSVRGRDQGRGQFRAIQNWIGRPGSPIERAEFVPPAPFQLSEHLDRWEKYYHSDALDPLVQLAVVHAQFEILHPFLDGDGRLGRILIPLFLFEKKLLSRPTFYLSEWFEERREQYVLLLRALERHPDSWNDWIAFFLTGVEGQAARNSKRAREVMDLYERLKRQIIGITHSQFAIPLLDQLFDRPVFTIPQLHLRPAPERAALSTFVRQLRDAGILATLRESAGRRAGVYCLHELVNTCEGRQVVGTAATP